MLTKSQTNENIDSILAYEYSIIADTSWKDTEVGLHYANLAIPLLKKTKQWERYIYTLCGRNHFYNTNEQYDSMEINNILTFHEAKRLLPEGHDLFYVALNNLALVYQVKENNLKALLLYKEVHDHFDKKNYENQYYKAVIEENIATILMRLGDFKQAESYFKQSVKSWDNVTISDASLIVRISRVYHKLSELNYKIGNFKSAQYYSTKSINTVSQTENIDSDVLIRYKLHLVKALIALNQNEQSLRQIASLQSNYDLTPLQRTILLHHKGVILYKKGEFDNAISVLEEGLYQPVISGKSSDMVNIHLALSQIYQTLENIEASLSHLQRAIALLIPGFSFQNNLTTPEINNDSYSKLKLFRVMVSKGNLLNMAYAKSKKTKYLHAALDNYRYLARLTDEIRSYYQSDESELLLLDRAHDFYDAAIHTATLLYRETSDGQYLEDAFFFAEKSKSELLQEELRKKDVTGKGLLPDSLLRQRYHLLTAINYAEKRLHETNADAIPDTEKIDRLENELFDLQNQLTNWRDLVAQDYPPYASMTRTEPATITTIQDLLQGDQVMLHYFVGNDNITLFKIAPTAVTLHTIPNDFDLEKLVHRLHDEIKMDTKAGVTPFAQTAHTLYQKLLPQSLNLNNEHLLFIPDGPLENLPFDMLVQTVTKAASPKQLDYLILHHTSSYAFSSTIFAQQANWQPTAANNQIVGAFPLFLNTDKDLKFTEEVYELLKKFKGLFFKNQDATIANILQHIPTANVIHFSTHARGYDSLYLEPTIDLYDGSLSLSDLQACKLAAGLAVISTCESHNGQYRRGEGVMTLSRGFAYAGVPAVIASTAKVKENTTSKIMERLYDNLANGMPKPQALRQAKLTYLQDTDRTWDEATPYHWGTFLMIGNTHGLELETAGAGRLRSAIWAIGTLVALLFVLITRRGYWKMG